MLIVTFEPFFPFPADLFEIGCVMLPDLTYRLQKGFSPIMGDQVNYAEITGYTLSIFRVDNL